MAMPGMFSTECQPLDQRQDFVGLTITAIDLAAIRPSSESRQTLAKNRECQSASTGGGTAALGTLERAEEAPLSYFIRLHAAFQFRQGFRG